MPYSAYTKDPEAIETIGLEWSPHLATGEVITQSEWPSAPPGINVVNTSFSGTVATIKLSGGVGGQGYRFVNRITTAYGKYDWNVLVNVEDYRIIPTGPPYASVTEHTSYTPAAEGEEAFKLEMVAQDAADMVQNVVPAPPVVSGVLTAAMTDSQDTIPINWTGTTTVSLTPAEPFPKVGEVLIGSEAMRYSSRIEYSSLTGVQRGIYATTPSSHSSGDVVTEIGYAVRARRAELAVFEWLYSTRGWRPSRSGVLGSESYVVSDEVFQIVRRIMGNYYGRKGGPITRKVPMSTFPRRVKSAYDWQRGWYDI